MKKKKFRMKTASRRMKSATRKQKGIEDLNSVRGYNVCREQERWQLFLTFAHACGFRFLFFPFGRFVPCLAISAVVDSFEIVSGLDINS